jgi:hypothetical protein
LSDALASDLCQPLRFGLFHLIHTWRSPIPPSSAAAGAGDLIAIVAP